MTKHLIFATLLGLILRGAWAALVPVIPVSDSYAYATFARMLHEYGVYGWSPTEPSAYWPVGTSGLYAAVFHITGVSFGAIAILNVILSTLTVFMSAILAQRLFGPEVGVVTGYIMAVWPAEICFVTVLASEIPFIFFVLLGLAAWQCGSPTTFYARAVISGLCFGLACYFRPVATIVPFVLVLASMPKANFRCRAFRGGIICMLVLTVAVAPWAYRNTSLFGGLVVFGTNGGPNLWMGNNPKTAGYYMPLPEKLRGMNEYERDKILASEALSYIKSDPVAFITRTVKKVMLLHAGETIAVHWNAEGVKRAFGERAILILKMFHQAFWMIMLSLAIIGVVRTIRDRGFLRTVMHPALLIWAGFSAIYAVTVIQDRYHFPSHPFIAMFASVAILWLYGKYVLEGRTEKAKGL